MLPAQFWRNLFGRFGLLLALLLLVGAMSLLSERFLTPSNIINVLRQISINAIIACGMTVVIIGRGIDLSVGSLLAFTGVLGAGLAVSGINPYLAIGAALGVGLVLGAFNGAFVAYTRIAPFIVTLAGLTIFRGMALAYTDGRPITGLPPVFFTLGNGLLLGIPVPIWIMAAFILLTHFILRYTALGRAIYAIGGNEEAARLSGIPVPRVQLFCFAFSGLATALAAMVLTGRLNSAQPSAGVMFELDAIAAVVVGGTSLFGGRGGVFGTLVGALIIGVINNGMNLLGVPSFYQQIVKGGVILAALLIDRLLARRRES
ncbi:MAG: ribose ABC transporter permease [Truepera sp.]|nr:ribose ABC transporter permease [Truepera sp.]